MANTYLQRTPSSAGNRKTMTFSFWIKRSQFETTNAQRIFSTYYNGGANQLWIRWSDSGSGLDKIDIAGYTSSTFTTRLETNAVFRDASGWYHIVIAFDTTQATASNRVKIYVNGEQVTSLATSTYPSQNTDMEWNVAQPNQIGGNGVTNSEYIGGSMSHINFIDGTAYDATAFGEYDANGVWKIKTSPSVTYGTNGFFILKDGNSVTDQSGNGNNFTVGGGTLTNTEDNPSNVFATLNPLDVSGGQANTLSFGNTKQTTGSRSGAVPSTRGTFGAKQGKWYIECKSVQDGDNANRIGVAGLEDTAFVTDSNPYSIPSSYTYKITGDKENNDSSSSYGTSYTSGDIIGIALDLDNGAIWFSKNGTWQNSATISEIENGTTTNVAFTGLDTDTYSFTAFGVTYENTGGTKGILEWNFGNGYFGTTAVSSAGTNASGIGIFEYDVPTGYTALSTKGLNL